LLLLDCGLSVKTQLNDGRDASREVSTGGQDRGLCVWPVFKESIHQRVSDHERYETVMGLSRVVEFEDGQNVPLNYAELRAVGSLMYTM
jgi:hypothetical protein